ncbi:MAG: ATP-binding protein, partial [Pseudomonadota bacterium]
ADNGIGLPEEGRDRLTDPYVTTRKKGTGLGLAIVRKIVEQHGGTLALGDAPAKRAGASEGEAYDGAQATLRLPRATPRGRTATETTGEEGPHGPQDPGTGQFERA